MTETNDSQVDRYLMGRIQLLGDPFRHSPEGRFIICDSGGDLTVTDLFHTRTNIFTFDMNTMLILFPLRDSTYLGLGDVNYNCLKVFIKQTVPLTLNFGLNHSSWYPLSHPPNLYDGMILKVYNFDDESEFFHVKMRTNDDIQVSQLSVPMKMRTIGFFDGLLYGLVHNDTARQINHRQQIDLVKFSLSSGTYVQEPTVNWEIVECSILLDFVIADDHFCCVGSKVFVVDFVQDENQYMIISLDLDTKEWQRTGLAFPHSLISMHSDGERTLIVTTHDGATRKVYRFVNNQLDKLSNLVWLRLKRIFDARHLSYEFILSQLPANFKQKCPFSNP